MFRIIKLSTVNDEQVSMSILGFKEILTRVARMSQEYAVVKAASIGLDEFISDLDI